MSTRFSVDFYKNNRQKLRELFTGTAPIVISANSLLQKSADEAYPFVQDKNFLYLTGLNIAGAILVIDQDKEYIILPERSHYLNTFYGSVNVDSIVGTSGIAEVFSFDDGMKQLSTRLKRVKHIATIKPAKSFLDDYGMFVNPARQSMVKNLRTINSEIEFLDLRSHMVRLRSVKQEVEIEAIKEAIDLTAKAINKFSKPNQLNKYKYTFEIEADIRRFFAINGSDHAFSPIISSGVNSCELHHIDLRAVINKSDLIQFDIGAEIDGYSADISRSRATMEPTSRQVAVCSAVKDVQDYAISLIRPGVLLRDYEKQVEQFMGEKLRELLLIKTISSEAVREFFPHATSHFLGLDTHDIGDYDRPLEAGMIITCEPGIYIKEEQLGIRIEDDILLTSSGNINLSDELSRNLI